MGILNVEFPMKFFGCISLLALLFLSDPTSTRITDNDHMDVCKNFAFLSRNWMTLATRLEIIEVFILHRNRKLGINYLACHLL